MAGPAVLFQTGDHSSRPAAGAGCVLYNCTDHGLVYVSSGSSWSTLITLASGIADTTFNAKGDLLSASDDDTPAIVTAGPDGSVPLYDSGETAGLRSLKHNLGASAMPDTDDDVDGGYEPGSIWVDTTNDEVYICVDATDGAAVWNQVGSGGGSIWTKDIDLALTSLTDWTAGNGTWSIDTNIKCVAATSTVCKSVYTGVLLPHSGVAIIECDALIPASGFGSGTQQILIGFSSVATVSGSGRAIFGGISGNGDAAMTEAEGVASGLSNTAYTVPAGGTWVTVKCAYFGGMKMTLWIDGVVQGETTMSNTSALHAVTVLQPTLKCYSSSGLTFKYRNLKVWTLDLPA